MHNQQPNIPSNGLKRGYDEKPHGTTGDDYHFNANKDDPFSVLQQTKLAAILLERNFEANVGDAQQVEKVT